MKTFEITMVDTTTRVGKFNALNRGAAEKEAYNSDQQSSRIWNVIAAETSARIKKVVDVTPEPVEAK